MTRPTLSRALERFRQRWTLPIAIALAAPVSRAAVRTRAAARSRTAALAATAARHPLWAKTVAAAAGVRQRLAAQSDRANRARLRVIERSAAFAARSRAACRYGARQTARTLRSPRRLAALALAAPGTLSQGAGRLFGAAGALRLGLKRLRMTDAAIASLFAVALMGPALAPHLDDAATVALTRDNPLADRNGVRAERGVSLAAPTTPTLWSGLEQARAERSIPPLWVAEMLHDPRPLDPAAALAAAPRVIELEPAPIWSPELERLASLDVSDEYLPLETASIPVARLVDKALRPLDQRELASIELGAIDTGPVAPARAAALRGGAASAFGGPGLGAAGLAAINAGDYATGSVAAQPRPQSAWPRAETNAAADLPASIAEALNLRPRSTVPPTSAPIPLMRPQNAGVGVARTARVTVVLTAVGLNQAASRDALERLPNAVVFAVAPVAQDPASWVNAAQSDGRVALIELPMEPKAYPRVNPGPLTLLAEADAGDNLERLTATLDLAPEADGVATYLGGRFAASAAATAPVIEALKERELFMLETAPSPLSTLRRTAAEIGLPAASSVVSLDRFGQEPDLSEGFARLELAAQEKGHAIGVAVAVPGSVDALAAWARTLEPRGFRLTALAL